MSIDTIPTYAIGVDNGNSNFIAARFTGDGTIKRVTFPSASIPGKLQDLVANKRMTGGPVLNDTDVLEPDDHVLIYENESWFVGKTAFDHAKIPSTGKGDANRYKSDHCLRNTLAGIAALIPPDVTRCKIIIVTCLPLALSRNEEFVRDVRRTISNSAPCVITYNRHRIQIDEIRVAKVLAESIGPALKHSPEKGELTAVFDSGYHTFDFSVLNGLVPQMDNFGTIKIGVSNIAKHIAKRCKDEYRFDLSQKHTEHILRTHVALKQGKVNAYPSIQTARGPIDQDHIKEWVVEGCKIIGDQLVQQLAEALGTNDDGIIGEELSNVQFVGGGFYFFYEKFLPVIPHQKIRMSDEPENDTVDGLLWFAQEIADRKKTQRDERAS